MGPQSCRSSSYATLHGVGMRIECSCHLQPLVETWLGVVFLARDELGQGGDGSSVERLGRDEDFPEYIPVPQARLRRVYE
jgi:hypothetical protein